MGREKVILDEYTTKDRIPKTCAREVYKLTNKELETLCKGTKKSHGYFRTQMTLYSREKVLTLACKKYGCTRKNIAEVLAMDNPPIVHPLIEKPPTKAQKKKAEAAALAQASLSDRIRDSVVLPKGKDAKSDSKAPKKTTRKNKKETVAPVAPASSSSTSASATSEANMPNNVVIKLTFNA